mgnify:CR=1 FL=1
MKKGIKKYLILVLKGMLMGGSDIIPGVSGGTMALITGIYEKLIHSINKIDPFHPFKTIDFKFFIPLIIGIVSAGFLVSTVMHGAITNFAGITYSFFFGLILASAFFVFRKLEKKSLPILSSAILGFIFTFLFVGLNPVASNHSLIVIFFSGLIAIMAMVLPGISGAFILLIIGQYDFMLNVLKNLQIKELFVFGLGAIIGIFTIAKILDHLLEKRKSITLAFLIGLMLGALRMPVEKIIISTETIVPVVVSAIFGFLAVIIIEKIAGKVE